MVTVTSFFKSGKPKKTKNKPISIERLIEVFNGMSKDREIRENENRILTDLQSGKNTPLAELLISNGWKYKN